MVIYDPIANYDRLKISDPLVDPRGRSSADQIPTPQVAAQLNFPTQGVLDRYHRVGLLISLNNDSDDNTYYNKTNRFNNFYGNQNKKQSNILETTADYSSNQANSSNLANSSNISISTPTYLADTNKKNYNGVEIIQDSTSNIGSFFTPTSLPKSKSKSKLKKHNKSKKHKSKKENFELEGFTTETNYDTNYEPFETLESEPVESAEPFETSNNKLTNNSYHYLSNYELNKSDISEGFGNLNSNTNTKSRKNNSSVNTTEDNNILELISKKITDNWYKYFTSISIGNKIIKINVHNRNRRELYDGDVVFIQELGKRYRVQIDEMDMIEYNPYFF